MSQSKSSMIVTLEKEIPSKNTAEIISSSTNDEPILIKMLKLQNKPKYEVSEDTDTDNYNAENCTEIIEYKETLLTIKYADSLVQNKLFFKHLMSLHLYNKVIQSALNKISQFDAKMLESKE